jgi:hypothetical protein
MALPSELSELRKTLEDLMLRLHAIVVGPGRALLPPSRQP